MAHQRLNIYIIFDALAQQIVHILTCANDAAAIRLFSDSIQQKGTLINTHPEDFYLRCLGTIDSANQVDPSDNRVVLMGATLRDMQTSEPAG